MRVLVLTTDTTPPRPCARPTATARIVATLTQGNVSHSLVHPMNLLRELAVGDQVGLLVVDARSVDTWLPDVFGELRRRVLGPSRPTLVVVGDSPAGVHCLPLFTGGVSNWVGARRTDVLLDYWHWVCCQTHPDLGNQDAGRRLCLIDDLCAGRSGVLEMVDRRLHVRLTVTDGRFSLADVAEFDSAFSRSVRRWTFSKVGPTMPHLVGDAEYEWIRLREHGQWSHVLARDALEQQLQGVLRWFLGTDARTRFVESNIDVPAELSWRAEDLVDDGPLSRHRLTKGYLLHQRALVANDTALADVS